MKPLTYNNLSVWGYVGLFILFNLPVIGTPAIILFAIFGSGGAKSLARALIILYIIGVAIYAVLVLSFGVFPPADDGVEALRNIAEYLGV